MTLPNKVCPICETELNNDNVSKKDWLPEKPIKLDYAGRAVCQKCADWIENTEWD